MAEFKLGRIRFVWKGDWVTGDTYYKDDVVAVGGKVYICVIGHTASPDFFTDFQISPPKWNLVSDGQNYRGTWVPDVRYVLDDIVSYGARLYICTEVHLSTEDSVEETFGIENDIVFDSNGKPTTGSKWDIYAEGLDWKGNWTAGTRYRINDFVKYGATTYVCKALHTSAATDALGLEADASNWDVFNQGLEYKQAWAASGTRYKVNDVVQFGAGLYICVTPHTSTNSFVTDSAYWSKLVDGFEFEGEWSPFRAYQAGDIVISGGNQYIAVTTHSGSDPQTDDGTNWTLFIQGIKFLGEWNEDSSVEYNAGELVTRGGYTYIAKSKNTDVEPDPNPLDPEAHAWQLLNTGLRWRGVWLDDQEYVEGDVVRFGDNSYVCILTHFSEGDDFSTVQTLPEGGGNQNSRPDLDISGTYWNVLSIGAEESVLNTKGDLVYYAGAGPARLPIGIEGQVLEVSPEGIPEWAYRGQIEDVYFVAEHGTDAPAPVHGLSLDKPFRSIRYACEQVELGTKNPNARRLLELNRYFIQREIVEWTDAQVTAGTLPFTFGFQYSQTKCERDMGYIVDAIIWDITHGGNVRSREAALEYVNNASKFYTLGQEEETVASIAYGLTVIQKVLAQEAPEVNYQVTNGDNSTAVVDQYFEDGLQAEDVFSEISSLVGIITDAITDGTDENIPVRDIRNTLIKVSTGKYYEMLPIVVPAECCVIGDELRATNVQPRKASNYTLVDIFDSQFSYQATQRIEDIVGDIVQGIAVTPTTGNLVTQSQEFPFAVASTATGAEQAVRTIRKDIDFGLGTKHERVMPNPSGFDPEFGYARDLILKNIDFIKAEVIAYITNNYSSLKYSKTKCKQDVGYIVDALAYDLTYGGNWQSINAGLAYYAGTATDSPLQIDSEEKTATLAAYGYLRDILAPISRSIAVSPVEQTAVTQLNGEAGSIAAATLITDNTNDIITIIDQGADNAPATVYPDITGASAALQTDHAAIINAGNLTTVKSNVITFISTNFPNLTYEQAKCERDIELIAYAAAYDAVFGSNFASIVAGYAYRRTSSAKVYGDQSEATLAANLYAAEQVKANVLEASAQAAVDYAYQYANDMIFSATINEGANKQAADPNQWHATRQIELNKDFIVAEVHAYIDDYFSGLVTETDGTTEILTIADTSWLSINMPIAFTDPTDSANSVENSGLVDNQTYYVRNILSATEFQISIAANGPVANLETNAGDMNVRAVYNYSEATCARDVIAYLDAVKWDLIYPRDFIREYTDNIKVVVPSNYKTKYAARYYVNSILGCQEEDFYYLRNGTGLRLQTMEGLSGDLTPENEYGTRRVTAGAYASLDPGWGPDHQAVWITARSPYVQNCTTFGTAAVGQKIDGALHNGGNDSIVSNDFTQVISDGIGAWLLNNGRAEMVSVFTYYAHIGYLCESGGRARATNGNNSYGTFGSVAEGVDADEIPVTGIVDNRLQYNAVINNVGTDQNNIVALEYSHAGNEYTEALVEIFGAGDNEEAVYDDTDFRDGSVFEVRITEEGGDSTAATAGGEGYTVAQNTAQAGTTTGITIAATDGSISTAYIGMKIVLTGGTGAGQYGIIDTYNAGSKDATIMREVETVDASGTVNASKYLIEYVGTTDWASIGAPTPNYVGQLFTASGAGTGTGRAVLLEAGWETFALGRDPVAPNASTTYTIEPNVVFSAPPKNDTEAAFNSSNDWVDLNYFITNAEYLNTLQDSTTGTGSGAQFDIQKQGSKYFVSLSLDGGGPATISGTGYARLDTITINGSNIGGQNVTNDLVLTITSIGDNGEIVAFDQEGDAQTGLWLALSAGTAANISADGDTWSSMTMPAAGGNGWYKIASGSIDDGSTLIEQKYAVVVADASTSYVYSQDGINWTAGTMPGGTGTPSIAFGNNVFLKIDSAGAEAVRSADGGQNWASIGTLPSIGYNALTYGAGKFVAVRSGTNDVAYSSDNGNNWTTATLPGTNETWVDIAYGANMFIAIASTNNVAAVSPDGVNWYLSSYPGFATARHITFGNGMFVATTTSGDIVIHTQNGYNWDSYALQNSAGTPVMDIIAFGNPTKTGRFLTTLAGATTANYSVFLGARAKGRAGVASSRVFEVRLIEPGGNYPSSPASAYYPRCGVVDPGNIYDVTFVVRVGNGALAQPSFSNRGTAYELASASINAAGSNGFADFLQTGDFIAVRRLTQRPVSGSNVVFESLPDQIFKLVNTVSFIGEDDGSFTAFLQISPEMPIPDSPADGEDVTIRIRFSQVRLTGHDFLDIGTGGFDTTNYPGIPLISPDQAKETVDNDGGRVFFTATDQDGNFRVGPVFSVEQSTGVATLNAEAFNIAGLQELSLGEVTLGGNSASISEFSTDPFFTANSDTVVPTQRAIKAYIEAQIGGGGASLNVNSVTAGDIFISSDTITTVESQVINIQSRVNFTGGITGLPLAINYMLR